MSESILLLGSNGQVGQELEKILAPNHKIIPLARPEIDLTQPDHLRQIIREIQPQIIINAAAYTAVDKAETEPELATAINATAPQIIAEASQELGCFLIHLSTDYVFDGQQSRPYQETDATNPLGIYGKTKLAGEIAIGQTHPHHIILRTAWVYGTFGKSNFVKTMLRLGKERPEIGVVTDQIGSPTWAQDIADVIAQMIPQLTPEIAGTYHYTNSGVISWYDFAVAIFEEAQQLGFPLTAQKIIPITTAEYPTLARRPAYPVLACGKISQVLGTYPPHWRQRLRLMLKDWLSKS
ncbi:MAG: dTDP-4-dehydrorhamnose reductase [Nodularia sp. CChRGM 3473]